MSSSARTLKTLGTIGAVTFLATAAVDIYCGYIAPERFPHGWAPYGIHSLLMTLAGSTTAVALIGWLLKRRNDEVYSAAYRHGAQDILSIMTAEELEPLLLHQRKAREQHW